MKLGDFHKVIFLGIGGIGMSALARYFNEKGLPVYGYDKTSTAMTDSLTSEGIEVTFEDNPKWINNILQGAPNDNVLVIYTPAIPNDNALLNHSQRLKLQVIKRSKALGLATQGGTNISIAGTHGKTTTSCLLAHILDVADIPAVSFLGGVATNFNSNYHNNLKDEAPVISISEADEFDRSFLQLSPYYSAITNMDADHLDVYGDQEQLVQSFKEFGNRLNPDGKLFVQADLQHHFQDQRITTYGIEKGQICAKNVHIHNGQYVFDLYHNSEVIRSLVLGIAGKHNVENAVVASGISLELGISEDQLRNALASFRGVKRRFEYILREPVVYIDDYAHHPTELKATISSAKQLYPGKKLTGIFQPHLYSRTRDFVQGFAESLSLLDEVWLMDIYPARELPIPGITSNVILDQITTEKVLLDRHDILARLSQHKPEVLLTLGAGDIDTLVQPIKNHLEV